MFKLIAFSAVVVYGFACWGTMPKQCFTTRYALECQRVQFEAIKDWRSVTWSAVHSIRTSARS